MNKSVANIVLVLICTVAVLLMHRVGLSVRSESESSLLSTGPLTVVVAERTTDLVRIWQERQVQGRTLVHMGRFLHFVENTDANSIRMNTRDVLRAGGLTHLTTSSVTYRNFLRAAFERNMIRQKYHVFSPQDFKERFLSDAPDESSKTIVDNEYGSRSFYSNRFPDISEPVLLNVDASYFHASDVENFLGIVRGSTLKVDIVTFCLAEDSPDVSENERIKLHQALVRLGQRIHVIYYGRTAAAGISR